MKNKILPIPLMFLMALLMGVGIARSQTIVYPLDTLRVNVKDTLTYNVVNTDDKVISATYFKFEYNPDIIQINGVTTKLEDWRIVGQHTQPGVYEVAALSSVIRVFDGEFFSLIVTPINSGNSGLNITDLSWTDCNNIIERVPIPRPTDPAPEEVESLYNGVVHWVDPTYGIDSTDCTNFDNPCETLKNIESVLNPGDAVIFMAGVHRIKITPSRSGTVNDPITYAGYPGMDVVISGSDIKHDTWTLTGPNTWNATYTTPLRQHPATAKPQPQWRPEMLIENGVVYDQVYTENGVVPQSFYIHGPSTNPTSVTANFGDLNPNEEFIEMAARDTLFAPRNPVNYIVVHNLDFTHAGNSFGKMGCFEVQGNNWMVYDVNVYECSTTGIKFYGNNHKFSNVTSNYNGVVGWNSEGSTNVIIEDSDAIGNNTKGFLPNWHAGGGKFTHGSSRLTFDNVNFSDNNGPGIWFDIPWGVYNNVLNSRFVNNQVAGIFLEHGTVYSTVENNVVYGTRKYNGSGSGVRLQAASDNVIKNNTLFGNHGSGVFEKYRDKRSPAGHNVFVRNIIGYNAVDGSSDYEIRIDRDQDEKIVDHWMDNIVVIQNGEDYTVKVENIYTGHEFSRWMDTELHIEPDRFMSRSIGVLENPNSPDGWGSLFIGYGASVPQ